MYQIQTFFIATEWDKRSAYGVRLDRVPGLNADIKQSIKAHDTRNKLNPKTFRGKGKVITKYSST